MLFPLDNRHFITDYEYIHNELSKPGVTLKLLWNEYCIKINDGKYPVSYSKFCRGYTEHVQNHNYTNHIQHKPGIRTEVDWLCKDSHNQSTINLSPGLCVICIVRLFFFT